MGAHGYGPYSRGVCQCDVCRTAARDYRRAQRARRLASPLLVHGLRASYDAGCRCDPCKESRRRAYLTRERPESLKLPHPLDEPIDLVPAEEAAAS
jgi:hypothetical protein